MLNDKEAKVLEEEIEKNKRTMHIYTKAKQIAEVVAKAEAAAGTYYRDLEKFNAAMLGSMSLEELIGRCYDLEINIQVSLGREE